MRWLTKINSGTVFSEQTKFEPSKVNEKFLPRVIFSSISLSPGGGIVTL